ncbi:hypothetical protein QMU90_002633 [Edwardsiella ictaluri]|uniref:Phage tail protein n=1 Tax=Edwardsiella ictaluri TaxID=67780 RepID=A0ABY8GGF7_EDWIC|nr:contractile injection system protein, VgrG/Pvc8 family [Edwardsiella ictaluri]ELV7528754.1 hypothetical protein [Edwardsiella ictaluri]WFN96450.1 hypothetical protein MAY91_17350 [Edwardsiella ictaluri]
MELRLGTTPVHYCEGPGSKMINARLESFDRVDASGHQSDQLTLVVNVEGVDGLPDEGQRLTWFEGYQEIGAVRIGDFTITRITPRLFPRRLTIVATSAPFTGKDETGFKERRTRSWDSPTLGQLFREVVQAHDMTPRVDPELDAIPLGHVDQTDETDAAFLTRLAKEFDAVAKPMDGLYVLALRGRTTTISGKEMEPVTLRVPPDNRPGTPRFINCELDMPQRHSAGGMIARWQDDATGTVHEVKSGRSPYRRLPALYINEQQARQALAGYSRKNVREKRRITLDVPGDPYLAAESPITLDESFPNGMAGAMSIDRVVARGTRSGGYRMSIEATAPIK